MEYFDSVSRSNNLQELNQPPGQPLISGLPDDIAFSIISRVPRKFHHTLRCVSKRWRELVSSEEWYSHRKKNNLAETWVYALCRDKYGQLLCYVLDPNSSQRRWKWMKWRQTRSSMTKGMAFEAIGRKLYLLDSCNLSESSSIEVYCYDASIDSWSEVAPMPSRRSFFACAVLDEKLYAIGGLSSNLLSWDVYDPRTNTWESHSDTSVSSIFESSLVMDSKIYVRTSVDFHLRGMVYELSNGVWRRTDNEMASGWKGPAVVVDRTLYMLDQSSGTKLMMWNNNDWIPVGRFSALLTRPPCQLAAVGRRIVVVGRGLSSVIFDVGNARSMEGVMVSSSVRPLDSYIDVISCKCISI